MEATELYHHGVKGQKWGIIRKRKKEQTKTKSISEMTDEELTQKIRRLELEKRFVSLMREVYTPPTTQNNSPPAKEGKGFVRRVLEKSGENIATQASAFVMGRMANRVLNATFKDPSAVDPKDLQKRTKK